jgi:hypothetical protein
MGKKMLALTVNAAAEKIIRQELQRLGAPTRFLVVPGEGSREGRAACRAHGRATGRQHSRGRAGQSPGAAGAGDFQGRGAQRRRSAAKVIRTLQMRRNRP